MPTSEKETIHHVATKLSEDSEEVAAAEAEQHAVHSNPHPKPGAFSAKVKIRILQLQLNPDCPSWPLVNFITADTDELHSGQFSLPLYPYWTVERLSCLENA
jgi:hypothetical protein